jgi:transposase
MPPTKPPYPPEFRREAVQLTRTSERSIAQVARDLGVSNQTLRNWIKQARRRRRQARGSDHG